MTYDIEITAFAPDARTTRTVVSTAEEAWTTARAAEACDPCVVRGGRHEDGVSHGDCHLWVAGDRALVRLDAHREWHAMNHAHGVSEAGGDVWFTDSDGTAFPAQAAETVLRPQGFEALSHWLRTGQMLPSLTWT